MVRNYQPKVTREYNRADLPKLSQEYGKFEGSLREFARSKKIPWTTVRRWIKDQPARHSPGRISVLTNEEESLIVDALKFLADSNKPLDRDDIRDIVKGFIKATNRPSPFKNGIPGIDWIQKFERRHPEISKRKPELLTLARAKNMTPGQIHFQDD
jgi:hypothetical protein